MNCSQYAKSAFRDGVCIRPIRSAVCFQGGKADTIMEYIANHHLDKISLKCAISFINSLYSSSIFSLCNPDNVFNLISRIDCA